MTKDNNQFGGAISTIKDIMDKSSDLAHIQSDVLELSDVVFEHAKDPADAEERKTSIHNIIDSLSPDEHKKLAEAMYILVRPHLVDWLNKNLPALVREVVDEAVNKLVQKN